MSVIVSTTGSRWLATQENHVKFVRDSGWGAIDANGSQSRDRYPTMAYRCYFVIERSRLFASVLQGDSVSKMLKNSHRFLCGIAQWLHMHTICCMGFVLICVLV